MIFLVRLFFFVKSLEIILSWTVGRVFEGLLNLCQHCGDGLIKGLKECCTLNKIMV